MGARQEDAQLCDRRLYCLSKGQTVSPPEDSKEIALLSISGSMPRRAHCYIASDLDFGYVLGSLRAYRVTVFSPRKDTASFARLGLDTAQLDREGAEIREAALRELRHKFLAIFGASKSHLASKRESVFAQIRNLASGICLSLAGKGVPMAPTALSTSLSLTLYEQLVSEGLLREETGLIAHGNSPIPPAPSSIITAKSDSLQKYLSKVLTNPSIRANKEKSAKAQLQNLLHGAMQSLRAQHLPALALSEEVTVTNEVFARLVQRGVMEIKGRNVLYDGEAIEELLGKEDVQREICTGKELGRTDLEGIGRGKGEETAKIGAELREQIRSVIVDWPTFEKTLRGNTEETAPKAGNKSETTATLSPSEDTGLDTVISEVLDILCYQDKLGLGELYDVCARQLSMHSQLCQRLGKDSDWHPIVADVALSVLGKMQLRAVLPESVRGVAEALESLELHRDLQLVLEVS